MNARTKKAQLLRLVTFCAILLIAIGSIFSAILADHALKASAAEEFQETASSSTNHLTERMENYSDLLYSGRAFLTNSTEVTQAEWDNYFKEQQVFRRYNGVSTVSFLRYLDEASKPAFLAKMRSQDYFGGAAFAIRPEGIRERYTVAELVSTQNNVRSSFGIDTYAGIAQKTAMDQAIKTGSPQASEPFVLGTGVPGFAVYLPVYKNNVLHGFVMTSFRTDDFIGALMDPTIATLRYKIMDTSDKNQPDLLYRSPNWQDDLTLQRSDVMNVAGRTWEVTFATTNTFGNSFLYPTVPLLILAIGLLVYIPLFGAFFIFSRQQQP